MRNFDDFDHDYPKQYPKFNEYKEEFSTEFVENNLVPGERESTTGGMLAGIVGLMASVVALFTYPFALGIIGILFGGYAVTKESKTIGAVAIVLGIIAVSFSVFYRYPLLTRFF